MKPTYEQLEELAMDILRNPVPLPVLQVRVRQLFNIPTIYSEQALHDIINTAITADEYDECYDAKGELDALIAEYGDKPVQHLIEAMDGGMYDDDVDVVVSLLASLDDTTTKDMRREFIERLMLRDTSVRFVYRCGLAITYFDDPKSIPAFEKVIEKWGHIPSVLKDFMQMIEARKRKNEEN